MSEGSFLPPPYPSVGQNQTKPGVRYQSARVEEERRQSAHNYWILAFVFVKENIKTKSGSDNTHSYSLATEESSL